MNREEVPFISGKGTARPEKGADSQTCTIRKEHCEEMKKRLLKSLGIFVLAAFVGLQGSAGTVWAAGAMAADSAGALSGVVDGGGDAESALKSGGFALGTDAVLPGDDASTSDDAQGGEAEDGAAVDEDGAADNESAPGGEGDASGSEGDASGSEGDASGSEGDASGDEDAAPGTTGDGNDVSDDGNGDSAPGVTGSGNDVSGGNGESNPGSSEGGDSGQTGTETPDGKIKLATPEISWNGWSPSWPAVEGANGWYGFELQISRDGGNSWETFSEYSASQMGDSSVISNMSMQFHIGTEEGAMFRFCARALNMDDQAKYESSEWSEWSEYRIYTKPDKQLATVECWWDEENPGVICWNPVEGAWGYMTELYSAWSGNRVSYSSEFRGMMQIDYSDAIARVGEGKYYVKVWALSSDIDTCANGDKATSEIYDATSEDFAAPVAQWGWAGDGYNAPNAWNTSWTQAGIRVYDLHAEKLNSDSGAWEWFGDTRVEGREYDSFMTRARILESGTYRFCVRAWYKLEDGSHKVSAWSDWVEKTYTKPEQKLGNVTGAWDKDRPGVYCWNLVDNATGYWAELHKVELDNERPNGISTKSMYTSPGKFKEADFSKEISSNGAGQYYVIVRALSNDIDACANGDGVKSEIYNTRTTSDAVKEAVQEALEQAKQSGDAAAAVEALKEKASISEIAVSMQTDAAVLEGMKELEGLYKQQKGITVESPVVTEAAGVDASKVNIAGAALNAADDSAISLHIDVAKEGNRVDVPANHYAGSVQLDISLMNGATAIHELKMPVTVTMPIPNGLAAGKLVIVHYDQNGKGENVGFKTNGDGTVTFTVTHFSTFLFAEKKNESGNGNGRPVNPDNSQNGGGTQSGGNTENGANTPSTVSAQNAPLSPKTGQQHAAAFPIAFCGAAALFFAGRQAAKRMRR